MLELLRSLFDEAHYRRLVPLLGLEIDPLQHYLSEGWRNHLVPHPLFDVAYYLRTYPDVVAGGIEPWQHYLERGWTEGRDPHPLFQTSWYLDKNRDVRDSGMNPWAHYVWAGWREGRSPHPLFDGAYYLSHSPDIVAAGINPLVHYMVSGDSEGRRPNPLFDPLWYRQQFMVARPLPNRPSLRRFEPSNLPRPALSAASAPDPKVYAFTIAGLNYLPKAKILAASLRKHYPGIRVCLLLNEPLIEEAVDELHEFDEVVEAAELGIADWQRWLFKHNVVELSTAIKPMYMERLLARADAEAVFYFDPDIVAAGDLTILVESLRSCSILLTPHLTEPEVQLEAIADNEIAALKHGVFNLGFIGVRPTEEGRRFVKWWRERLELYCVADTGSGLFTDQRWIDLAPGFFDDLTILRNPGCNVATWNLSHRHIGGDFANGFTSNGQPLIFFHLSGFDSGAQEAQLERYGFRMPAAFELRRWYVEQLQSSGAAALAARPWTYAVYDDGTPILDEHRRLYRDDSALQQRFEKPFATGEGSFSATILNHTGAPAPVESRAGNALIDYLERWHTCTVAPNPHFDAAFYIRANGDIAANNLEPLSHYLYHGAREYRAPNARFDPHFYRDRVAAAEGQRPSNALVHYLEGGAAHGYRPLPVFDDVFDDSTVRRFEHWADCGAPVILAIIHVGGGGTEYHVRELARNYADRARFFLLQPISLGSRYVKLTPLDASRVETADEQLFFDAITQCDALVRVLKRVSVQRVHVHHAMGNEHYLEPLISALGVPFDFTMHDYYVLSPSPSFAGRGGRFVGEDLDGHAHELIEHARFVVRPPATLEAWQAGHRWLIERADRVIVPSHDVARRLRRSIPAAQPIVAAHPQAITPAAPRLGRLLPPDHSLHIAVIGELGREKGLYVLRDLACLVFERSARIRFTVIGKPHEDHDVLEGCNVEITGPYVESELQGHIAASAPDLIWFPSLVPETFCYALSAALATGLPAVAPALGAFPERLGGRPWTWIEPWDRSVEDWFAFFDRLRSDHFVTGTPPIPPAVAEAPNADFYEAEYLAPVPAPTVTMKRMHVRQAAPTRRIELLGVDRELIRVAHHQVAQAFERAARRVDSEPEATPRFGTPRFSCLITITPRSGSTMLAEWLTSVGGCGLPQEYFNPDYPLEIWAARVRRFSIGEFTSAIVRTQQTPNGVFSMKTDFARLIPFISSGALTAAGLRPRFVYVVRRDLVAQAVSLHRAFVSGSWTSLEKKRAEAAFDFQAIRARLIYLAEMMAQWERFFSVHEIEPLRLVYEDMLKNPEETVAAVARHVGVSADIDLAKLGSRIHVQRDDVSRRWAERFRAALALRDVSPL